MILSRLSPNLPEPEPIPEPVDRSPRKKPRVAKFVTPPFRPMFSHFPQFAYQLAVPPSAPTVYEQTVPPIHFNRPPAVISDARPRLEKQGPEKCRIDIVSRGSMPAIVFHNGVVQLIYHKPPAPNLVANP
jgi:hypothetical protein